MRYVSGTIFTGEKFIEGYIGHSDGIIRDVGEGLAKSPEASGIILPSLVNSHTHIGDAFIRLKERMPLEGSLDELVKPPNGLKHRLLSKACDCDIIDGMKEALASMFLSGVGTFIDFREGGIEGVKLLGKALSDKPVRCAILSRPGRLDYDPREVEELLETTAGIGASGIGDWNWDDLKVLARHTKESGKLFAIHASEGERENLDRILELQPDMLVHMTCASEEDLAECAGHGIPIVVCPRSTKFFGGQLRVKEMLAAGIRVLLGTDNAMLNSPSLWEEMKLVYDHLGKESANPIDILRMVTTNPQKVLNAHLHIDLTGQKSTAKNGQKSDLGEGFFPALGDSANFAVVKKKHPDPGVSLVNRTCPEDVRCISLGDYYWKKEPIKGDFK